MAQNVTFLWFVVKHKKYVLLNNLFALCTNFPERGSHCIVTSLSANTNNFKIKLDRVSCRHFMSIHNLQCRVKLNKIGKRDKKKIFEKTHCIQYSGTEINFVRVIVTYAVVAFTSFRLWHKRLRFTGHAIWTNKTKFGQMQALTNDNYSEIKLYNLSHIEYKAIEFCTNNKEPTITFPIPILERQWGSHW